MGFRISAAPDEATIYEHADGTSVVIEEPDQKEISKALKDQKKGHPVTGNCTPESTAIVLQEIIIARDTQ